MSKLIEMIDILIVADRLRLSEENYKLVKKVGELLELNNIDRYELLKNTLLRKEEEFLYYIKIIEKLFTLKGTSEEYCKCIDMIEDLRDVKSKFIKNNSSNFLRFLALFVFVDLNSDNTVEQVIEKLNKNKIFSMTHDDIVIYINDKKYITKDVTKHGYIYTHFARLNKLDYISGNIGMMIVKNDNSIVYYKDNVIKSGEDKVNIIKKIGIDKTRLVVTRSNISDTNLI